MIGDVRAIRTTETRRRLFTTADALEAGVTEAELRWGQRTGRWRRVAQGVYAEGSAPPSAFDRLLAPVLRNGVARGRLAGVLHELDGVPLGPGHSRRRALPPERIVSVRGVPCANGVQTLIDLAHVLDDVRWEQALECGLRKRLLVLSELASARPARIRRVLALRPVGAPPTESLLETLMVQLIRTVPDVPEPTRQYQVFDIARVDLCWPEVGVFVELDGQQHKDQPVYDAKRETAVAAATGWLCGRFTWHQVVNIPATTRRDVAALVSAGRWRGSPGPPRRRGLGRSRTA